jgi:hypothetical protein
MDFLILNTDLLDLLYAVSLQIMPEEVGIGNFRKVNNVFLANKYQYSFFDIVNKLIQIRQADF